MRVRCKKCGYTWDYGGRSKIYVTCPQCLRKTPLRRRKKAK